MTEPSDEALMERYRDGDAGAFEQLYSRHKGGVFRYFLRQCGNRALAEEMHQDVWMRLVDMRSRYRPTARFTTMLYTMAHNRLVDHYRRSGKGAALSFDQEPELLETLLPSTPANEPERRLDAARGLESLVAAVEGLPAPQREAFVLRHDAGLSVEELAGTTGVNRETAKSRLRYAMSRLRQALGTEHGEP